MKATQIIVSEFEAAGLAIAEEVAEKIINITFDKVMPRLAVEADEQLVKSVAAVIVATSGITKPMALKAVDGIDKSDNA